MTEQKMIPLPIAAQRLGLPYRKAYELALAGDLRAVRVGSRWLIVSASVEHLKRRGSVVSRPVN